MRLFRLPLIGLVFALAQMGMAGAAEPPRGLTTPSVVKVRAYHAQGKITAGSAVLLDGEQLATNCHVTAGAQEIEITQGGRMVRAEPAAQDPARDLCLLNARGLSGVQVVMAKPDGAGQLVYAAGFFKRDRFAVTTGRIVALHDYDGAKVIQVSARFDYGASGGGLFDERGHLIGILTFKARAGGAYHFAIPAQWIAELRQSSPARVAPSAPAAAFWQQPPDRQPFFLRAAALEVNREWHALAAVGERWTRESPTDPYAWTTLETALRYLAREDEADSARREALRLALRPAREAIASADANAPRPGDTNGGATCVGDAAAVDLPAIGY